MEPSAQTFLRRLSRALQRPRDGVAAGRARVAMLFCSLLALLILTWTTWDHVLTAIELQRTLGVQVVDAAEDRLMRQLRDLKEQLVGFVHQEQALTASVLANPESPELRESLWSLLQLVFPAATAGLLLDTRGIRSVPLGANVAKDSELFLRQFARNRGGPFHLSRRGTSLSVDLAASWYDEGKPSGYLLIDLNCAGVCGLTSLASPEGHNLVLNPAVASGGSSPRAESDGKPPGTLLARTALGGTGWLLEDRLQPAYFSHLVYSRVILATGLGAAFLLATAAIYRWADHQGRQGPREPAYLRDERQLLPAILSVITDGILVTDAQGRIQLFNAAAEMMFGRLAEDVLNAKAEKLIPNLFSTDHVAALLESTGGRPMPVVRETTGQQKGGKEFPLRLWIHALHLGGRPRLLIVAQDLTEHLRNEKQLAFLEQCDVLTGLPNRKQLEERLTSILADVEGDQDFKHVLCHIDVDQFKLINDTCGHQAGDELLKQLAILINGRLAGAEVIARLGGDEFSALFAHRTAEDALEICEGLLQTVRNFLFTWRERSFDVAVSIGLVEFGLNGDSASSILSKADVACQMAKAHGRDRIHLYSQTDVELVRHHGDMRLVSTISQALSDGRFHLYAQPIAPLAIGGGKHRHFEVLVRMVNESGEAVIPDRFIPAAERYILMPAVDRWIINRLFSLQAANLREWQKLAPRSFLFAVNLSGTSITDGGFLRYLKRQFLDWDVPPETICFEITETAAVRNLERARGFMQELGALGCVFALDDFGTGLSSYSYLRALPVSYLKIDGSFVRSMAEDPVDYALVESINQIGHVLGLKTIAEWAEDRVTLNQLRALNVDFAQGFGVGQTIPVSDLTLTLATAPSLPPEHRNDPSLDAHRSRHGLARPA